MAEEAGNIVEYSYFYEDGVEAEYKRHVELEWIPDEGQTESEPGDPIKWFGTWEDISSSDYPGIKIYRTSLVVDGTGVTIPGVGILISQTIKPGIGMTRILQHEYGHFLDSKFSPDLNNSFNLTVPNIPFINYMLIIGIPSAFDLMRGSNYDEHHDFYTEKRADQWAEIWFGKNYKGK